MMKVNIIVEIRDQGAVGASYSSAEVGPHYTEEQLAERAKKHFRAAKANLNERLAAKAALAARQAVMSFTTEEMLGVPMVTNIQP